MLSEFLLFEMNRLRAAGDLRLQPCLGEHASIYGAEQGLHLCVRLPRWTTRRWRVGLETHGGCRPS